MKKYTNSIKSKILRLLGACLGQLIWLLPLGIGGWYAYTKLPEWSESYFGVAAAQQLAQGWNIRLAELSEPVLWNPATIAAYLKALFASVAATSKLYTLVSLAGMVSGIGRLVFDILGVLAIIYAILRMKRAYRAKTQVHDVAVAVSQSLLPEIEKMQAQISELTQQVNRLTQMIPTEKQKK